MAHLSVFEAFDMTDEYYLNVSIPSWDGKAETLVACLEGLKRSTYKDHINKYVFLIFVNKAGYEKLIGSSAHEFKEYFDPVSSFEAIQGGFLGSVFGCAVFTDVYTYRLKLLKHDVEICAVQREKKNTVKV